MNNSKFKTKHANILEKERIHVYEYMLKTIISHITNIGDGYFQSNFLCHLLIQYNELHGTKYELENFPELVSLREDNYVWWLDESYKLPIEVIENVFPTINKENLRHASTQTRMWVLLEAIGMLKD